MSNNDYQRIAQAIEFITQHATNQPRLEEVAAYLQMSPFHFQRLFARWAGVTPKRFLQALTVERAKELLKTAPIIEVADQLGLSSGSRLYDHFVKLEAVTPGEFKTGGAGLTIAYAKHDTPFGSAFIATTPRGICRLSFIEANELASYQAHLAELAAKWPQAKLEEDFLLTQALIETIFSGNAKAERPLSLHVIGTNFQVQVWRALLQIPPARLCSYSHLAHALGRPKAARAVGTAVGANPVGFLIPCHRVIQQSGKLGGYFWGEPRKHAIHAWESAR